MEVEEGYKVRLNTKGGDPNITELYIEKEINIYIHKLVNKPEPIARAAGGAYSRRQRKRNTKNSRKYRK